MVEPVKREENICSECGAPRVEGLTCWEQLGGILGWEYQDPDLRAEHFLTVAAYNLQHPAQFVEEVVADLRAALIEHLAVCRREHFVPKIVRQTYIFAA